jgi:CheY-like chemotaxis protein
MAPKILVVDRNQAFATMLREMLETEGGYQAEVAFTGGDALSVLRRADFALTIVDMDLDPEDIGYRELIRNVRQLRPTTRLMLIPLMGEDLPPEAHQFDIQGALAKPFFADDLLPKIRRALAKEVPSPIVQPSSPPPPQQTAGRLIPEIQTVLSDLARETNADAILLVPYSTDNEGVVTYSSVLDDVNAEALATLVVTTVSAAQDTAQFLGQPDRPFAHSMFETESLRLYVMALSDSHQYSSGDDPPQHAAGRP